LPATFVRAAYFMENWASGLSVAKQGGVLPSFVPAKLRFPMVATQDIAEVAAQALLEGPRGTRIIELAGPSEVSADDVASAVAAIFGRAVKVAEVPFDAVVPTLTGVGFSAEFAAIFREMHAGIASGLVAWEGQGEALRGQTTLEQALRPLV
jgi:uncharacterized protein YbjT (DUF2867 family)